MGVRRGREEEIGEGRRKKRYTQHKLFCSTVRKEEVDIGGGGGDDSAITGILVVWGYYNRTATQF
jgi:hypothetical protein